MKTPLTATQVATMKRRATALVRAGTHTHSQALEKLARDAGYSTWHEASAVAATIEPAPRVIVAEGKSSVTIPGTNLRMEIGRTDKASQQDLSRLARMLRDQQLRRDAAHEEGMPALQRLFTIAQGDSGQCRRVAWFLLGLYNGMRFPFDLTELRSLDEAIFEDCMRVLRMDASPKQEVHRYFENGGARFERMARDWRIPDVRRLTGICEQLKTRGVSSFGSEGELGAAIQHALESTFPEN